MQISLKILSGPAEGQILALSDGMTIGRQDATLNLEDPRVSTLHARIVRRGESWRLIDNASKNGVRDPDGNKVKTVNLEPGARFAIGESQFEVFGEAAERSTPPEAREQGGKIRGASPPPRSAPPQNARSQEPAKPSSESADVPAKADLADAKGADRKRVREAKDDGKHGILWHQALAAFVNAESLRFRDRIRQVALLEPALVFDFVRGPQVNARWILGYGPRRIGGSTLDLPLWEPDVPPICFEITPTKEGVLLTSSVPQLVRVNGLGVDRHVLSVGDRIEIRETLIEVDFSE